MIVRKPERELSPETRYSCTLSLQSCEKIVLSHPVYGISLWQPELTNATPVVDRKRRQFYSQCHLDRTFFNTEHFNCYIRDYY